MVMRKTTTPFFSKGGSVSASIPKEYATDILELTRNDKIVWEVCIEDSQPYLKVTKLEKRNH